MCTKVGEDFLYTHTSGEKSFNMLISFLEEDFLEFLFDKVIPHLELRAIIFIASFDSSKNIYLFFMFIYYLKDDVMSYLFPESNKEDTANNIEETETKSDITEEITSENMNKE